MSKRKVDEFDHSPESLARRLIAAERIGAMQIEDVPEPGERSRELAGLPAKRDWARRTPGVITERIEVRLDKEDKQKLAELAKMDQASTSDIICSMIGERYEQRMRKRRFEAARRMVSREIEDAPEPEELKRQLAESNDPGRLY